MEQGCPRNMEQPFFWIAYIESLRWKRYTILEERTVGGVPLLITHCEIENLMIIVITINLKQ